MTDAGGALLRGVPLAEAKALCVFIHGRGQTPELMDDHVIARLRTPGIAYVLPRAPSGSWYQARAIDPLSDLTRRELGASLDLIKSVVDGLPSGLPLLLGSFSQGACVALEFAMRYGPWNGGLAALTGCRVGVATDARPASDLSGMPAYLSNSNKDGWIPLSNWSEAVETFGNAGARLRTDVFPGRQHEVSDTETGVLDQMLQAFADGHAPWEE